MNTGLLYAFCLLVVSAATTESTDKAGENENELTLMDINTYLNVPLVGTKEELRCKGKLWYPFRPLIIILLLIFAPKSFLVDFVRGGKRTALRSHFISFTTSKRFKKKRDTSRFNLLPVCKMMGWTTVKLLRWDVAHDKQPFQEDGSLEMEYV